ncbi:MAG: NAD(P)H-hydrate dehydratase [Candidatus Thermoplasmatota archaeon]
MISGDEARALDINAQYHGVSAEEMMERAGKGAAEIAMRSYELKGGRVAVVCGPGNNGGDGLVAARYLSEIADVVVHVVKQPKPGSLGEKNLQLLNEKVRIREGPCRSLKGYALIIDALLGIGLRGEIREPYSTCIGAINASSAPVLSIDVPSGLGTGLCVKPEITVTFHDIKEGMDAGNSGRIEVVDVGMPRKAAEETGPGEMVYYPLPHPGSHKGMNGRVLVISGGPYTGAPALSALGAMRIGADLAFVAVPKSAASAVSAYSMDVIVRPLNCAVLDKSAVGQCLGLAADADAVLIGPGLGRAPETMEGTREIVSRVDKPIVVDADAFHALAGHLKLLRGREGILTPHAGEFEVLRGQKLGSGIEERKDGARALSKATGMTVLLKGPEDVIAHGSACRINRTGVAAMSVGGTGDVLAGLCAALLSKGVQPFHAARIAAFVNGRAGEEAFHALSYGMLASDLLEWIPHILKQGLEIVHGGARAKPRD